MASGQSAPAFALVTKNYGSDIVVTKDVAERDKLTTSTPIDERLKSLKGLRVAGWTPGSSPDMLVRYVTTKIGLRPDVDLTILPVGPVGAMLAAMENNRIDAFAFSAPGSLVAVSRFNAFLLLSGAKGEWAPLKDMPYMCLMGNADWLRKEPEVAAKIYRGLSNAMAYVREHPDDAKRDLRKRFSAFDDKAFEEGFKDVLNLTPATPALGPDQANMIKGFVETVYPNVHVQADKLIDNHVRELAEAGK